LSLRQDRPAHWLKAPST